MRYMKAALEPLPAVPFTIPDGIVFVRIDPATGLLAPEGETRGVIEVFAKGTEPTQQVIEKSSPAEFFKFDKL
jgi:penicillin-binding protein 1A